MRHSGSDNGRLCLHGRQEKLQGYGRRQAITGGDIRQHGRQAAGFQAVGKAGKWQGSAAGEPIRQAAARQEMAPNTGGFCNTFGAQNATKTETLSMRTRVNPVILYVHTVILEPKKTLPLLRIFKKKFKAKKCPDWLGKRRVFQPTRKIQKNEKNYFLNSSGEITTDLS